MLENKGECGKIQGLASISVFLDRFAHVHPNLKVHLLQLRQTLENLAERLCPKEAMILAAHQKPSNNLEFWHRRYIVSLVDAEFPAKELGG